MVATMLSVHPKNPQPRLIKKAAQYLLDGGLVIYPNDMTYAIAWTIGNKNSQEKVIKLRKLDKHHHFTLICANLKEISKFADVNNSSFRILKAYTPGPITFVLRGTHHLPRRVLHSKRKTLGIRVPANPVAQALLEELGEPMLSTTVQLPTESQPMTDPDEIITEFGSHVDAILDAGAGSLEVSTIVDLTTGSPEVIRQGLGDFSD